MPARAVYANLTFQIFIHGEKLDELLSSGDVVAELTLQGKTLGPGLVHVSLSPEAVVTLSTMTNLEKSIRAEMRKNLPEYQPGYSNRKIRKGKGHGKG